MPRRKTTRRRKKGADDDSTTEVNMDGSESAQKPSGAAELTEGSPFQPPVEPGVLSRPFPPPENMAHAGRLEFSPEKAGLDVTPLNLEFADGRHRGSNAGLNPITGKIFQHKISSVSFELNYPKNLQWLTLNMTLQKFSNFSDRDHYL
jgi:hypothetical protein